MTIKENTTTTKTALPVSILTKNQKKTFGPKIYTENGTQYRITAKVRYDDECNNGHNSFSITGEIYRKRKSGGWEEDSFGCLHDKIAKHFPELAHLIKWHLCASDGPMYYMENTLYHVKQHGPNMGHIRFKDEKAGLSCVSLEYCDPERAREILSYHPDMYTYELDQKTEKKDELQHARSCAIWPEATDEDLLSSDLRQKLVDRLPGLMAEFQKVIEEVGFIY